VASKEGEKDVARLLLGHGADANHSDVHEWTPLHVALEGVRDDIVRLLLDHGALADTNYPDNHGLIPLHVILRQGHRNLAWLLLDHGTTRIIQTVIAASGHLCYCSCVAARS
jgi:ankyrin repeat protein